MTDAYFERLDEAAFRPGEATGGGWDPDELHIGPIAGLLVHAIRRFASSNGTPGLQLSRVTFDILGRMPVGDYTIDTAIRRAGRTIELIEAHAVVGGRAAVTARAWRLKSSNSSAAATNHPHTMPPPEQVPVWSISDRWPGTFAASLDVKATDAEHGRVTAWLRTTRELIAGEPDPIASYIALIDVANGIATHQTSNDWFFPNVDLTVHLHREPRAGWVGLDTSVTFGSSGLGLTSTVLHDIDGPVGRSNQSLTVRRVLGT